MHYVMRRVAKQPIAAWVVLPNMGQKQSVFAANQLELYRDCTYFTEEEILKLYKRFCAINPGKLSLSAANVTTRLPISEIQEGLCELRANPFRDRICEVFSTDGYGLHFEDFLDMLSVLSERAPWDLKATYAFRIYDFNSDAAICQQDIEQTLGRITGDGLSHEEVEAVASAVLEESDMSRCGKLSYAEFEHVVARAPDFVNLFHIRVV